VQSKLVQQAKHRSYFVHALQQQPEMQALFFWNVNLMTSNTYAFFSCHSGATLPVHRPCGAAYRWSDGSFPAVVLVLLLLLVLQARWARTRMMHANASATGLTARSGAAQPLTS
jgi:hypothetical protein